MQQPLYERKSPLMRQDSCMECTDKGDFIYPYPPPPTLKMAWAYNKLREMFSGRQVFSLTFSSYILLKEST